MLAQLEISIVILWEQLGFMKRTSVSNIFICLSVQVDPLQLLAVSWSGADSSAATASAATF
jgi:hypothetical protein